MYPLLLRFNNSNYGRSKNFIFILFLLPVATKIGHLSVKGLKTKKHKTRKSTIAENTGTKPVALAYKFSRNSSSFGSSLVPALRVIITLILFCSSVHLHERFCLVCSFGPTGPGPAPRLAIISPGLFPPFPRHQRPLISRSFLFGI